jgi:hypothetical protein
MDDKDIMKLHEAGRTQGTHHRLFCPAGHRTECAVEAIVRMAWKVRQKAIEGKIKITRIVVCTFVPTHRSAHWASDGVDSE